MRHLYRRGLIALALLALSVPASAVTRYNVGTINRASGNPPRSAPLSPVSSLAGDAAWEETGSVNRARMVSATWWTGDPAVTATSNISITEDTGNESLGYQFSTGPLAVGTTFTSGVTTVTAVLSASEGAGTDDVIACIMGVRVVSLDGSTVRATLLAVGDYGDDGAEFPNSGVRNETCANADTVTASYTTVSGDRIVWEFGAKTDGAETTPAYAYRMGKGPTADCALDNTSTTACAPWIEFSNTFSEEQDSVLWSVPLAIWGNATDASTYTSSSITPLADHLLIGIVINSHGTAATTPTLSGNSLTWDEIATATDASGLWRITMFRAMGGSPTSGTVVASFGGTTQTGAGCWVIQVAGAQTGSNGANAIVQSNTNTAASGTSLTVTLSAFGSSNNQGLAAMMHATNNEAHTLTASDIYNGDRTSSPPNVSATAAITLNDNTLAQSWTTSSINLGMAIEIKQNVVASAARTAKVIS